VTGGISVRERGGAPKPSAAALHPYGGAAFAALVAESYAVAGEGSPGDFHQWLRDAYRASGAALPATSGEDLEQDLASARASLHRLPGRAARARAEAELARWAHRFVKQAIPRFSLDRGHEFCNVVKYGERQCLLQSVLIAGLLQAGGCDAGVVMVYANERGEQSNNGHVTVLLKLDDGAALLVDASDPEPFAKHSGLLVRASDYRYVTPVYQPRSSRIAACLTADTRARLAVAKVSALDLTFVGSQFWFYRGERAPGGVIAGQRTAAGLAASRQALEHSVRTCPANPLAVYMLGRTLLYQGDGRSARKLFFTARDLYRRYGWVPPGVKDALAATSPRTRSSRAVPPTRGR
jgi:hypothetical protein